MLPHTLRPCILRVPLVVTRRIPLLVLPRAVHVEHVSGPGLPDYSTMQEVEDLLQLYAFPGTTPMHMRDTYRFLCAVSRTSTRYLFLVYFSLFNNMESVVTTSHKVQVPGSCVESASKPNVQ